MEQSIRKALLGLQSRHSWKKSPYFICEGLRCCREAFSNRPEWIDTIIYHEEFEPGQLDISCPDGVVISDKEFAEVANTEQPQGVMLLMRKPDVTARPTAMGPSLLVLDRVADPGNVGTILRTAWAMDMGPVIWTAGTCHPLGAKAIRAGMGAQFAIELMRIESVEDLPGLFPDRTLWITSPRAEITCYSETFEPANSCIILGNEAGGAEDVSGAQHVCIPMPGNAESLNVAQAATVIMYETIRRRSQSRS